MPPALLHQPAPPRHEPAPALPKQERPTLPAGTPRSAAPPIRIRLRAMSASRSRRPRTPQSQQERSCDAPPPYPQMSRRQSPLMQKSSAANASGQCSAWRQSHRHRAAGRNHSYCRMPHREPHSQANRDWNREDQVRGKRLLAPVENVAVAQVSRISRSRTAAHIHSIVKKKRPDPRGSGLKGEELRLILCRVEIMRYRAYKGRAESGTGTEPSRIVWKE